MGVLCGTWVCVECDPLDSVRQSNLSFRVPREGVVRFNLGENSHSLSKQKPVRHFETPMKGEVCQSHFCLPGGGACAEGGMSGVCRGQWEFG